MNIKIINKLSSNYLVKLVKFSVLLLILIFFSDIFGKSYRQWLKQNQIIEQINWRFFIASAKATGTYDISSLVEAIKDDKIMINHIKIKCLTNCLTYLSTNEWKPSYSRDQYAQWVYKLGLAHYQDQDSGAALQAFDLARQLAPEWSYFHLELANLYLFLGNQAKAEEVLYLCTLHRYSKLSCQRALDNFPISFPVGFYKDVATRDMLKY